MLQFQDNRSPDIATGGGLVLTEEKPNRSEFYDQKTKYIVTEYYRNRIELKDAIVDILHSRYKREKQKRSEELTMRKHLKG